MTHDLDPELIAAALSVYDRIERGEPVNATPTTQLKPQKGTRPHLLCLDMSFWVQLGRLHFGKATDGLDVLNKLQDAVNQGHVVVAMDDANAFEAGVSNDVERRRRLCSFMVETTRNHALLPHAAIRPLELSNAVVEHFGGGAARLAIRSQVLRRGLYAAHGVLPPEAALANLRPAQRDFVCAPEMSLHALMRFYHPSRDEHRRIGEEGLAQIIGSRLADANMTLEQRRAAECENIDWGNTALQLNAALDAQGIDRSAFRSWLQGGNAERFWTSVPTADVTLRLMLARDRNPLDKTQLNDLLDWQLLEKALPYADAVGTEAKWVDYAGRAGLDRKYGTTLIGDLKGLSAWLDAFAD
jgi:hypothetical protein